MIAHSGVLRDSAGRSGHHGWLHRHFLRRVFLWSNRDEGSSPASVDGMQDVTGPWNTVMTQEDLAWLGEQRCIEQKQRAVGHM
jgi:hypothetical protein